MGVISRDGTTDGNSEGSEVGCVDGNAEGTLEGLFVESSDTNGVPLGSAKVGWTLVPDSTRGGQLAPPSEVIVATILDRVRLLVASQPAQPCQLPHKVTMQSAGHKKVLQTEASSMSGHAAPTSRIARLRCRKPMSQVAEHAVHTCK